MTLNLMSKNHSDSIVYVDRVAIVTHHSEPLLSLTCLLENVQARVGNSRNIRDKVLTVSIVKNHVSIGVHSECNVHELRRELKMQHLNRKMLSSGVVKGNTAVDTAGNEEIARWGVRDLLEWLVELTELVGDAGALDIEDSHHS